MKALVTGGAGFIGSHLVDGLIESGYEVRVLDALIEQVHGPAPRRPRYLHPRAELRVGDVQDRAAVRDALEGVDVVLHHAAAVGVGQSMYEIERYVRVNCAGSAVLLEEVVARRERIRKLVVASSMSVYGEGACRAASGERVHPSLRPEAQLAARRWEPERDGVPLVPVPTPEETPLDPGSVYAITKRDQEEMGLAIGRAYGIPTVALRYFNVYGSRQALTNPYTGVLAIFASRLLGGRPPLVFEDGLQSRDFVHVSDIVQANLLALDNPAADGRVYNVGTGRAMAVIEVGRLLARALGVEPGGGTFGEVSGRYRAGDIRHCHADISRIEGELGYRPRVELASGIEELAARAREVPVEDRVDQATRELVERGLCAT